MAGNRKSAQKAEPARRATRASKRKAADGAEEAPAEAAQAPEEPPAKRTSKRTAAAADIADEEQRAGAPAEAAAPKATRSSKRKADINAEASVAQEPPPQVDEPAETAAAPVTDAGTKKGSRKRKSSQKPAAGSTQGASDAAGAADEPATPAVTASAPVEEVTATGAAGGVAPEKGGACEEKGEASAEKGGACEGKGGASEEKGGASAAPPTGEAEAAAPAADEAAAQPADAAETVPQPSPGKKGDHGGRGRGGSRGGPGRGRQGRREQGSGGQGGNSAGRAGRGRGGPGRRQSGRGGGGPPGGRGRGAGRAGRSDGMTQSQRAHRIRATRILQRHAAAVAAGRVQFVPMQVLPGQMMMPLPGQILMPPMGPPQPQLQPMPPAGPPPAAEKPGAPAPTPPQTPSDPLLRAKQTQMVLSQPTGASISFSELKSDVVIALAEKTWGLSAPQDAAFDERVVTRLYRSELAMPRRSSAALRRIQILEVSQYLERYLWPHFDAETASPEHVMSIIIMVNEKIREGVPAWDVFLQPREKPEDAPEAAEPPEEPNTDAWHAFVKCAVQIGVHGMRLGSREMGPQEVEQYLRFVIHLFQSLEAEHVRAAVMRMASLPIWAALSPSRRELELHRNPDAAKKWKSLAKKDKKAAAKAAAEGKEHVPLAQRPEATFLPALLDHFLELLPAVIRTQPVKTETSEKNGTGKSPGSPQGKDAVQVHAAAPGAALASGAGDVEAADEPVKFFEMQNEPVRMEDLPPEADEAQLLGMHVEEDAAPGVAPADEPEEEEDDAVIDLDAILPHSDAPLVPPTQPGVDRGALRACERFLELLVDLLAQLPTRRFLVSVVAERGLVVRARMSAVASHPAGTLFCQLLDQLAFYTSFPIDDHTGNALTDLELGRRADDSVLQLQRLLFTRWPSLRPLALTNCATLRNREKLSAALAPLPLEDLTRLACTQLRLVRAEDCELHGANFVREVLISHFAMRTTPRAAIAAMPLYPTEALLWDDKQIPSTHYAGDSPLALPKLNLQFLTFWDYLLRNFNLFRLEATYEIREDVTDTLKRLQPRRNEATGGAEFMGWSRMAIKIESFVVVEVARPRVGEVKPAAVTAELVIDLAQFKRNDVRDEWDELKEHDVLFLLTVQPPSAQEAAERMAAGGEDALSRAAGLQCLRGAELIEIRDSQGALFNDFRGRVRPEDAVKGRSGTRRTLLLALDAAQYQLDVDALEPEGGAGGKGGGAAELYASFNVVQRRKAKENNFKAVLESIRDLMTETTTIPTWMHDLFLGYGAPEDTQFAALEDTVRHIDFRDTFLDASHIPEAFPNYSVQFVDAAGAEVPRSAAPLPPYKIKFPAFSTSTKQSPLPAGITEPPDNTLVVSSYKPIKSTPYPEQQPGKNNIRFNTEQLSVILSGMQPGLTMCVGPPGTGKTDTAVQVLTMLYHNYPQQRTLVVAHSNQALNDVFSKTIQRDVPARYLLRLGMGQEDLDTDVDFSRTGRVNAMLQRRLDLLEQVATLAQQLGESEDAGYTCETAGYFFLLHVLARWERFNAAIAKADAADLGVVARLFPFTDFFATVPPPLFAGMSREQDMEAARICWRHLRTMFTELQECRAFELLRGQADRVNYLVTKHAKVVAMTCTHAALKRREFLDLGFRYDTLVMEESAQILEIETLLPMLLQKPQDGHNRLKRIVLIGDHHQLPPVVKNQAFQRYSKLDQPLFTRFIRLGVPHTELSAQGRARPQIADLYNWRYRALGNLPHVVTEERFRKPNAGFLYNFQFVDVPPMLGPGESCPTPYFYQNIDEAEFAVRVFMYMRLIGYPASKITILTSYNGQKALLEDVVQKRCARYPAFGVPAKIATVDKYQGQQNDYVLLSLVRTRRVGHLRDVRRLVVAMSRARLGLYVLGCRWLFEQCLELAPTFRKLLERPSVLALMVRERWAMAGGVPRETEGGSCDPEEGGIVVQGLQQLEGVVQGIADRYHAEQKMLAAQPMPPPMPPPAAMPMQPAGPAANGASGHSAAAPAPSPAAVAGGVAAAAADPLNASVDAVMGGPPEVAGGADGAGQDDGEGSAPMDASDT